MMNNIDIDKYTIEEYRYDDSGDDGDVIDKKLNSIYVRE